MDMTEMEIITVEQTAQIFGVEEVTVRDWIKNKRIPAKKIGKRWFISKNKLTDFIEKKDLCPNCLTEMVSGVENNGFSEPDGPSHNESVGKLKCPDCDTSN